jgi:dolichol-phosphate mannosyltransferase
VKLISLVVPLYDEAEMADIFLTNINSTVAEIKKARNYLDFEIIAVNDGSRDATYQILKNWYRKSDNLGIVSLSRNFGQEAAVFAGLEKAKGAAVIVMDCDLQDPPEAIIKMIEKWEAGADIVNAVRVDRTVDGKFKKSSASLYYKFLNRLSGKVKYPHNVNNFRLVSRRALDVILAMPEKNKFFRGLVPYAGFKTDSVEIVRQKREKGKSKYNLKAQLKLASDGIAATTVKPLVWPLYSGALFFASGLLGGIALALLCAFGVSLNYTLWGIIAGMGFFGGIIMIYLGIIGFYVGKSFEEIKARPQSITEEYLPVKKISYD